MRAALLWAPFCSDVMRLACTSRECMHPTLDEDPENPKQITLTLPRAQVKHKVVAEGVLAWVAEQGLAGELGGAVGVLVMAFRALLVAGAKSFTHMITALERYHGLLADLLAAAGPEVRANLILGLDWVEDAHCHTCLPPPSRPARHGRARCAGAQF